jgi:hypothetical protein
MKDKLTIFKFVRLKYASHCCSTLSISPFFDCNPHHLKENEKVALIKVILPKRHDGNFFYYKNICWFHLPKFLKPHVFLDSL